MIVQSATTPIHECNVDALIVALGSDWENSRTITELDIRMSGRLSQWIRDGELSTKSMKTATILTPNGLLAKSLILVGLGKVKEGRSTDGDSQIGIAFRAAATGAKIAAQAKTRKTIAFAGFSENFGTEPSTLQAAISQSAVAGSITRGEPVASAIGSGAIAQAAVAGSITGGYGQDLFKSEPAMSPPDTILWYDITDELIQRGKIVGESMIMVKRLVNLPANYLYPESFADEAIAAGVEAGFQVEVWDEAKLIAEECNSLLAVSKGSTRPPRLCIFHYPGAGTNMRQMAPVPMALATGSDSATVAQIAPEASIHGSEKTIFSSAQADPRSENAPIALIGKGVTFDSGGYSIKPTDGMLTMKCDMAGAATVLGIVRAASLLKIRQPIIGLVGLVENMIAGNAMKLGDVLTARSGKTIEIHNTDAEGRLVLADVLNVALDYAPSHLIDFATLTGAVCVALGNDVVGVMSNDAELQTRVLSAASTVGEYAWPLPMFPYFAEQIAGKVADIKNVGEGRWGGAITAAKFLEQFVDDKPWVHLDIAGPAFLDSAKSWCDAGGTATMVRTILQLLDQPKQPN